MKRKCLRFLFLAIFSCTLFATLQSHSASFNVQGDIDGDGQVGLKEAVFALQVSAGLKTPACVYLATGTYTYDSGSSVLTANFTNSSFPSNEGPPLEIQQFPVISISTTTMVLNDIQANEQITLTRDSGFAGDVVGTWQMLEDDAQLDFILEIGASGSVSVCAYFVPRETLKVSNRTIIIDGDFSDWTQAERVYQDDDGPDCDNIPGRDIKEVYVAQDTDFIYVRFVLNGALDNTFGYKFGEWHHIYVGYISAQAKTFHAMSDLCSADLPFSYVAIVENQFECKFEKCSVSHWEASDIEAWCDQGHETVCRDRASIPILTFDFSNCNN